MTRTAALVERVLGRKAYMRGLSASALPSVPGAPLGHKKTGGGMAAPACAWSMGAEARASTSSAESLGRRRVIGRSIAARLGGAVEPKGGSHNDGTDGDRLREAG